MNASFDPFHLVNTYGAFGGIGRTRQEVVIEGTDEEEIAGHTVWKEYEFKGKPGDSAPAAAAVGPVPSAPGLAHVVRRDLAGLRAAVARARSSYGCWRTIRRQFACCSTIRSRRPRRGMCARSSTGTASPPVGSCCVSARGGIARCWVRTSRPSRSRRPGPRPGLATESAGAEFLCGYAVLLLRLASRRPTQNRAASRIDSSTGLGSQPSSRVALPWSTSASARISRSEPSESRSSVPRSRALTAADGGQHVRHRQRDRLARRRDTGRLRGDAGDVGVGDHLLRDEVALADAAASRPPGSSRGRRRRHRRLPARSRSSRTAACRTPRRR